MGWKKFIMGEKMPDKAAPEYRERYEKEVDAGRRFARWSRIDILAVKIQLWANGHKRTFLGMVFAIVIGCFVWNIMGIIRVVEAHDGRRQTVSEQQEQLLDSLRNEKLLMESSRQVQKVVEQK